jgi:hypothetical protein
MSILTESYVPNLILQLNSVQKQINYRGIVKDISQEYWIDKIAPLLYPKWDTDKDKLIQLNYYDTGDFHVKRRKFVKNFSTGEYEWKDYEMEIRYQEDIEDGKKIFEVLKEAFYLIDSVEKDNFQKELAEAYYQSSKISWYGIRLVRQFLLQDSDWVLLPDSPLSVEDKELWKTYRQSLRDIPQVDEYLEPTDVMFPITPEEWNFYYKPNAPEGENYLGSLGQFIKLSGYFVNHFKERIVQYLIVKQSIMSPLNYRNYVDRMNSLPVFSGVVTDPLLDSEEFVNKLLENLTENSVESTETEFKEDITGE